MHAVIVVSILINLASIIYVLLSCPLNPILAASVVFYCVLWLVTPAITGIILEISFFDTHNTIIEDFSMLYAMESAAVIISLLIFSFVKRKLVYKFASINPNTSGLTQVEITGLVFWTAGVVYSGLTIYLWSLQGSSYTENNDLRLYVVDPYTNVFRIVRDFFTAFFIYAFFSTRNKCQKYVSLCLSVLPVVGGLAAGSRLGLVLPLFMLAFSLGQKLSKQFHLTVKIRIFTQYCFMMLICFVLFMGISISVGQVRSYSKVDIHALGGVVSEVQYYVRDLFAKFDSFSAGNKLVEGYGAGTAGFAPYRGSILFGVPRIILPSKPIAGSINDSYFGTPARLVPALNNYRESVSNVGVSPLAISVWHWGWVLGTLVFWISSALNIFVIDFLLNKKSMWCCVFAVYAISIPSFLGVFPSPDVFVKHCSLFVVIFISVSVWKKVLGRKGGV